MPEEDFVGPDAPNQQPFVGPDAPANAKFIGPDAPIGTGTVLRDQDPAQTQRDNIQAQAQRKNVPQTDVRPLPGLGTPQTKFDKEAAKVPSDPDEAFAQEVRDRQTRINQSAPTPQARMWDIVAHHAQRMGIPLPTTSLVKDPLQPLEEYNAWAPETPVAKGVSMGMDTMGMAVRPIATLANEAGKRLEPLRQNMQQLGFPMMPGTVPDEAPPLSLGDTLTKAAKSIPPEWAGRDTSKDVDVSKVISQFLPDPVALTGDVDRPIVDPNSGEMNWGTLGAHGVRGVRDFYVLKKVDPMMRLHPGLSEESALEQAARSKAAADLTAGTPRNIVAGEYAKLTGKTPEGGLSKFGQWTTPAEAEAFSNPSLSARIAAGQVGIGFGGYGPIPKYFLDVNPKLAPALKFFDPVAKVLTKAKESITGPNPRSTMQIAQKTVEGENAARLQSFDRQELGPGSEPHDILTRNARLPNASDVLTQKDMLTLGKDVEISLDEIPKDYVPKAGGMVPFSNPPGIKATWPVNKGDLFGSREAPSAPPPIAEPSQNSFAAWLKEHGENQGVAGAQRKSLFDKYVAEQQASINEQFANRQRILEGAQPDEVAVNKQFDDAAKVTEAKYKKRMELHKKRFSEDYISELLGDPKPSAVKPPWLKEPVETAIKPKYAPPTVKPTSVDLGETFSLRKPREFGFAHKIEELRKTDPVAAEELEAKWKEGREHFNPAKQAVDIEVSTFTPTKQAAYFALREKMRDYAVKKLDFMRKNGMNVPELNYDIKARPRQLFDTLDAIDEASKRTSLFGKTDSGLKVANQWDKQVGTQNPNFFNTAEVETPPNPNTEMSAKLKGLIEKAKSGLDAKDLTELQGELRKGRFQAGDLDELRSTIKSQLPLSVKQAGSVADYRPGMLADETKEIVQKDVNPILDKPHAGQNPENAERAGLVRNIDKRFSDMGNVKQTVEEAGKTFGVGSRSTQGVASSEVQPSAYDRFMTATGLKKVVEQQHFEGDPYKASVEQGGQTYRAMNNSAMDDAVKNIYNGVPHELVQKIWNAVYNERDTGTVAAGAPAEFRNYREGYESPMEYNDAKEAFFKQQERLAKQNPPPAVTVPVTMDDLEAIWKANGGPDTLRESMDPKIVAKIDAGKMSLKEAIPNGTWTPFGRSPVQLGQDPVSWIHSGVADELKSYKALGNDPIAFGKYIRGVAPILYHTNNFLKKTATVNSPAFLAYMLMKQAHDQVRFSVDGAVDAQYPGEVIRGQAGHWDYVRTGDTRNFPMYDGGPKIGRVSGDIAAQIAERAGALNRAGHEFQEFNGKTAPEIVRNPHTELDTGDWGTNAKNPLEQLKDASKDAQDVIQYQDNANRTAALFARLRAGDTLSEAALRVNRAGFDFSRQGPVTKAASQSLVVPFAAWHSKVIPFMAHWAITNPGEFMLVQKMLQQANAGLIPPSQLPTMLKDQTNIPLYTDKDVDGHTHVTVMGVTNFAPGSEALAFMDGVAQNGGIDWLDHHLGGPLRMLKQMNTDSEEAKKDPEKRTTGERVGRAASAFFGRGASTFSTLMDPSKSDGEKANMLLNPAPVRSFDFNDQQQITIYDAKHGERSAEFAAIRAQKEIRQAQADYVKAHKDRAEAEALKASELDPKVIAARQREAEAQARILREQQDFKTRVLPKLEKTRKAVEMFQRAP